MEAKEAITQVMTKHEGRQWPVAWAQVGNRILFVVNSKARVMMPGVQTSHPVQ